MGDINPVCSATFSDLALEGWLVQPGLTFPIPASSLQDGSDSDVEGRYHDAFEGCLHGGTVAVIQDTDVSGTGLVGTPIRPGATYPWVNPYTRAKGVCWLDGTDGALWGGTLDMTASKETHLVEIERGIFPPGSSTPMTGTSFYTTLTFLPDGAALNFRLSVAAGLPILLQMTRDSGATWRTVMTCPGVPDGEAFLQAHNRRLLVFIRPDYASTPNVLRIELNNGYMLRVSPTDANGDPLTLPDLGPFKVNGKNGMATVNRYPLRHGAVKIKKKVNTGGVQPLPDSAAPIVEVNGRYTQGDTQTNTTSVTSGDGQYFDINVTAQHPDAGSTSPGSSLVPVVADVCLRFPHVWRPEGIPDAIPRPEFQLTPMRMEIDEYLDDTSRTLVSHATLYMNNEQGQFAGGLGGHKRLRLYWGTAGVLTPYFQGIAGVGDAGCESIATPHARVAVLHCQDDSYKLQRGTKCARQYDGWALPDAVKWEAQYGQIQPTWLADIPVWSPNGGQASAYAPDCPFYILARGTGLQAAHEYKGNVSPWTVLQGWAQDTGDASGPNYMGLKQPSGQFHFGSFDPTSLPIHSLYTTVGLQSLRVINSIPNLRTAIDLQTLNPITYELETAHVDMPAAVKAQVGFHDDWLERNVRFGGNLQEAAYFAQKAASVQTQIVHAVSTGADAGLHAGMRVVIDDDANTGALNGVGDFYTIHVRTVIGESNPFNPTGHFECYQSFIARNIYSF